MGDNESRICMSIPNSDCLNVLFTCVSMVVHIIGELLRSYERSSKPRLLRNNSSRRVKYYERGSTCPWLSRVPIVTLYEVSLLG